MFVLLLANGVNLMFVFFFIESRKMGVCSPSNGLVLVDGPKILSLNGNFISVSVGSPSTVALYGGFAVVLMDTH